MAEPQSDDAGTTAMQEEDQNIFDQICNDLTLRPHLAFPLAQWMIPSLTFAPSQAVTGPGCKRFTGKITPMNRMGFCFVSCREAQELFERDVFIHSTQQGRYQPGDMVDFAVLLNKDGKPQAFDLTPPGPPGKGLGAGVHVTSGSDVSTPTKSGGKGKASQASPAVQQQVGQNPQQESQQVGTITKFHPEKGFGFIHCQEIYERYGKDVWLHHAQIKNFKVGDAVAFTLITGTNGMPQALDLWPANGWGAGKGDMTNTGKGITNTGKGIPQAHVSSVGKGAPQASVPYSSPQVIKAEKYVGTVTSFMPEKGFGFIKCPEIYAQYTKDVWVHSQQLGRFTIGDTVGFTMVVGKNGAPQAIDLESETTESFNQQAKGKRLVGEISDQQVCSGVISNFDPTKNFGFISCEETQATLGKDVWLHGNQLASFNIGDVVSFTLILNKDGKPQAIDLHVPGTKKPRNR